MNCQRNHRQITVEIRVPMSYHGQVQASVLVPALVPILLVQPSAPVLSPVQVLALVRVLRFQFKIVI